MNHISDVMVSVLAWSAVDRGFEPRLGQTKDYYIGMCCFFAKHAALRRKSKDRLAQNQNNIACLSTDCCFSELALYKSNLVCGPHHHLVDNKLVPVMI